jgi:T-complex protein 1 subunit delta
MGCGRFREDHDSPAELRGLNDLVLAESNRSINDALYIVRSLVKVKERDLINRGRAAEMEASLRLRELSMTQEGLDSHCFQAYADALEVIPTP